MLTQAWCSLMENLAIDDHQPFPCPTRILVQQMVKEGAGHTNSSQRAPGHPLPTFVLQFVCNCSRVWEQREMKHLCLPLNSVEIARPFFSDARHTVEGRKRGGREEDRTVPLHWLKCEEQEWHMSWLRPSRQLSAESRTYVPWVWAFLEVTGGQVVKHAHFLPPAVCSLFQAHCWVSSKEGLTSQGRKEVW